MPRLESSVVYNSPEVHDFAWDLLECASGLRFAEPQRSMLIRAMNRYLQCLAEQHSMPPMKAVKNQCERIQKHAKVLAHLLLLHLTNDSHDNDRQQNLQNAVLDRFPLSCDPESLARQLN